MPREPALTSRRLLFVDDEPVIGVVVQEMLSPLKWEVTLAYDGQEAVDHYSPEAFDVVILDLTMPGSLGALKALPRLRRIDPTVRAVVCSGSPHDPVMTSPKSHGFVAALAKPFSLEELIRVLSRALESPCPPETDRPLRAWRGDTSR